MAETTAKIIGEARANGLNQTTNLVEIIRGWGKQPLITILS